ncbi:unnamed protein product [Brassica napus]|uniref:(rape) hypothetical protein n=1 Tax=Brassica napus TaxID=3708 RepID=A0A816REQ5_BRANA|nr:unnamed protein product [Brassica napus]
MIVLKNRIRQLIKDWNKKVSEKTVEQIRSDRGKVFDLSDDEQSGENTESRKADSDEVEEIELENVELLVNIKKTTKWKKRKTKPTLHRNNPKKKKSARKVMTPSRAYTQTSASLALAEGSVAKSSHLEIEDTWGYLAVVKKGHLEKTVTGLVDFILVLIKEFCAGIPNEISNASKEKVEVLLDPLTEEEIEAYETFDALSSDELADFLTCV